MRPARSFPPPPPHRVVRDGWPLWMHREDTERMKQEWEQRFAGSGAVFKGLKGFMDCEPCQCYPEGRNDCPKARECRMLLYSVGYQRRFGKDTALALAQEYAAAVRARKIHMQVLRLTVPFTFKRRRDDA